ncbi:kinesin-like protein KIF9 [Sceloporus undulatus]|uniref:kinesin-like protein KIF9 n=1 Tax=Sceloporus undulatus TaxID=8520 RepID=UPI001C4BB6D0|nr:kinesin-like protein KIF9 [Sceloporus undulatus]XP_042330466.1 kinesin-like protein KIF9 [Sceloporus undulatus]XP_042330468.1 kinesin-like protein KIF9 [Sceloporus undulatus]
MYASSKRVTAFARVKPTAEFPQDMIKFGADNKTIDIYIERDYSKGIVNNKQTDWSFKLDGVLHDATQDAVYEAVAQRLVTQGLSGYNGTIICYGQTGAGKTFTMTGTTENYLNRGLIPRAIQQVFKSVEEHGSQFITVRISYLEIYNETIFDLLSMMPSGAAIDTPLSVVESPQGVSVKGLTIHPAPNEETALNLLFEGDTNRSVGQHALNKHSSRSHCIFTIYIECHSRILADARYVTSKINLVDLAGSERLAKSKSEGRGLKEATYINKSLSFLEQVIIALSDQNREHVPFRQSKLTYILKDSLGGNCNTVLVANICSEPIHIVDTLSTLRFATRTKWVTTEPVVNEKIDSERMVKNLEKEVLYLKEELAMHNSLLNRPPVSYEPLNEIQIAEINSQVRRYLEGTIDELDIVSIRQTHEVFNQFKAILSQQEQEVESRLRSKYTLIDKNDFATLTVVQKAGLVDAEGHLVGEVDGQGFGIGVAPFSSKPGGRRTKTKKGKESASPAVKKEGLASPQSGKDLESVSLSRSQVAATGKELEVKETREQDSVSVETHRSDSAPKEEVPTRPSSPPTKTAAFEDFKSERGSEINRIFKENKSILNDRRKKMNEVAHRVNMLKQEMDTTRQALEAQKLEREQQGEYLNDEGQIIIDEEEFLLIIKLKDLRKQYRVDYNELQKLRSEVQYCQHLVDQCRNRLLTEFDIWYNESFLIPEEVQEALRPGGTIRLGMIPINRVLTLDEDDQERFDRMQQEVLPFCPASVSFYNAKAKVDRKHKYSQAMATLEQMRKKPGSVQAAVKNKPPSALDIM